LALRSLPDRLSTWDRRSPITRFSFSERVSVPDRLSFVVRLSAPDRFLMSPIVCLRWLPRIVVPTRYRGLQARDKLPLGNCQIGKSGASAAEGKLGRKKTTPSGSKSRVPAAPITGPIEIPSAERIAGAMATKCELAHNRAHSFQNDGGSGPPL
jgi:hypothetical protein